MSVLALIVFGHLGPLALVGGASLATATAILARALAQAFASQCP